MGCEHNEEKEYNGEKFTLKINPNIHEKKIEIIRKSAEKLCDISKIIYKYSNYKEKLDGMGRCKK